MKLSFVLSDAQPMANSISLYPGQTHWTIPWNTGLPSESGRYLVTDARGDVGLAEYSLDDDSGSLVKLKWEQNIIAWSVLPDPYEFV